MRRQGLTTRLAAAVVGLVAMTVVVIGVAVWLLAGSLLRAERSRQALELVRFDLGVIAVEALDTDPSLAEMEAASLPERFRLGPDDGLLVRSPDGDFASGFSFTRPPPDDLARLVADGRLGYVWSELGGDTYLVVGSRRPPSGPDFYFWFAAADISQAQNRVAVAAGSAGVALILVGLAVARSVARGVLAPVREAAAAADRVAAGDLDVRLPDDDKDEFGRWSAAFNAMAESLRRSIGVLQEAEAAQRRFVADVSHELKTPLAALVAETALLAPHLGSLPPAAARAGELLVEDVARLRSLIVDLLEVSGLDAGAVSAGSESVELAPFLQALVDRRGIETRVEVSPPGARIDIDRAGFERVVGNLVDNAHRHGAPPIEARASVWSDRLELVVADRGPGLAPADLDRVFDRFYKVDPARAAAGSGLGLAIARSHARRMGGDLNVTPRVGGGLEFTFWMQVIPVTQPLHNGDVMENRVTDDDTKKGGRP